MLEQWYWVMPNEILFSKELSDKQKLLYCLISSLCAEKWHCRATNDYLWELLDVDRRTIARNISELWEKWYIFIEIEQNYRRKISLVKNDKGVWQKCHGGCDENDMGVWQKCHDNISINRYMNNITNNTNEYTFEQFWKDYPHARKWKKWESEKYFRELDPNEVKKQTNILKRKIRAWIEESKYIPACERWIRDFTPLNDDVIKQDLTKICKRHLTTPWDEQTRKQRAMELKQTFWEETIKNTIKQLNSLQLNFTT